MPVSLLAHDLKGMTVHMTINILPGIIILIVTAFLIFVLLSTVLGAYLNLFKKKNPIFWEWLNKYYDAVKAYEKVKDDAVFLTAKVEALQQEHKTLVQQNEILVIQRDHLLKYIDEAESKRAEEVAENG